MISSFFLICNYILILYSKSHKILNLKHPMSHLKIKWWYSDKLFCCNYNKPRMYRSVLCVVFLLCLKVDCSFATKIFDGIGWERVPRTRSNRFYFEIDTNLFSFLSAQGYVIQWVILLKDRFVRVFSSHKNFNFLT